MTINIDAVRNHFVSRFSRRIASAGRAAFAVSSFGRKTAAARAAQLSARYEREQTRKLVERRQRVGQEQRRNLSLLERRGREAYNASMATSLGYGYLIGWVWPDPLSYYAQQIGAPKTIEASISRALSADATLTEWVGSVLPDKAIEIRGASVGKSEMPWWWGAVPR